MSANHSRGALRDESVKSSGSSSGGLPAIDETRRSDEDVVEVEQGGEEGARWSGGPASPCRKRGVKERVRGLKDKYVSCLHAIDGAGDVRPCAGGGGPPCLAVPTAALPFDAGANSAASLYNCSLTLQRRLWWPV